MLSGKLDSHIARVALINAAIEGRSVEAEAAQGFGGGIVRCIGNDSPSFQGSGEARLERATSDDMKRE